MDRLQPAQQVHYVFSHSRENNIHTQEASRTVFNFTLVHNRLPESEEVMCRVVCLIERKKMLHMRFLFRLNFCVYDSWGNLRMYEQV